MRGLPTVEVEKTSESLGDDESHNFNNVRSHDKASDRTFGLCKGRITAIERLGHWMGRS